LSRWPQDIVAKSCAAGAVRRPADGGNGSFAARGNQPFCQAIQMLVPIFASKGNQSMSALFTMRNAVLLFIRSG
jgi:hypothetical protein